MPALVDAPAREERPGVRGAGTEDPGPKHAGPASASPTVTAPAGAGLVSAQRRDWTALPEAAALLADCANTPPATRIFKVTDLTTFHACLYVGARVRRLQAIHRAEAARLFALCEAARNYDAFDAHVRRTVQQAIADARFHAALACSAACDKRALEGRGMSVAGGEAHAHEAKAGLASG